MSRKTHKQSKKQYRLLKRAIRKHNAILDRRNAYYGAFYPEMAYGGDGPWNNYGE